MTAQPTPDAILEEVRGISAAILTIAGHLDDIDANADVLAHLPDVDWRHIATAARLARHIAGRTETQWTGQHLDEFDVDAADWTIEQARGGYLFGLSENVKESFHYDHALTVTAIAALRDHAEAAALARFLVDDMSGDARYHTLMAAAELIHTIASGWRTRPARPVIDALLHEIRSTREDTTHA
ncbi:hypothetical protein ABQF26_03230 [Mycolicibacterium elephantis]